MSMVSNGLCNTHSVLAVLKTFFANATTLYVHMVGNVMCCINFHVWLVTIPYFFLLGIPT